MMFLDWLGSAAPPSGGLTYYEGLNPSPPTAYDPVYDADIPYPDGAPVTAKNNLAARFTGSVTTQPFESRAPGSSLNGFNYSVSGFTFQIKSASGGNPDTSGIVLQGYLGDGRYNTTSGGEFYINANSNNGIRFDFSAPISAFGCYVTDAGDFSGQWSIVLVPSSGPEVSRNLTQSVLEGALIYIGFADTSQTYTSVKFICTGATSTDGIGFDDVTAATAAQIV